MTCSDCVLISDAMPTEETFVGFPNSHVTMDDMMDDVVDDSKVTKVFTERSHHQNFSVIFMTQNIFHPGRRVRTILRARMHCLGSAVQQVTLRL